MRKADSEMPRRVSSQSPTIAAPTRIAAAMSDARTILLEKSNVVAGGLKNIAGFETAYEDDVAIVLLQGAHP